MIISEERKQYKAAYNRERYHWLKDHGICTRCGQRDAMEGMITCPLCREKANEYKRKSVMSKRAIAHHKDWAKERYETLKEQGICILCGKRYSVIGEVMCKPCKDKRNKRRREMDPGGEKSKVYMKERRRRLASEGKCQYCGRRKAIPGQRLCDQCKIDEFASQLKYRMRKERERGKRCAKG